ncbi:hypothetical protein ACTMU2_28175 [Cupriavidus basilensis]
MDGVFLIALILFAAASAALLQLCAALGGNGPEAAAGHGSLPGAPPTGSCDGLG